MVIVSPTTVYSEGPTLPSHPFAPEQQYEYHHRHQLEYHSQQQVNTIAEFIRARPKGVVRFPPFEVGLTLEARRSVQTYRIYPFGAIQEYCRHIPYASGKKDFHEKTGREGFEVFQYIYKVPGEENEYHVMWDYNIGLVRMTPFFKCRKYSKAKKTTPAKMLNMNPGLREITHSITGGSIMAQGKYRPCYTFLHSALYSEEHHRSPHLPLLAIYLPLTRQGYWMPYECARAICATFCYPIADALIPLFGPDFRSECIPTHSPDFGRMVIDQGVISEATQKAEQMRRLALNAAVRNGSDGSGRISNSAVGAGKTCMAGKADKTAEAAKVTSQQFQQGFSSQRRNCSLQCLSPDDTNSATGSVDKLPLIEPSRMLPLPVPTQLAAVSSPAKIIHPTHPRTVEHAVAPPVAGHDRLPPVSYIESLPPLSPSRPPPPPPQFQLVNYHTRRRRPDERFDSASPHTGEEATIADGAKDQPNVHDRSLASSSSTHALEFPLSNSEKTSSGAVLSLPVTHATPHKPVWDEAIRSIRSPHMSLPRPARQTQHIGRQPSSSVASVVPGTPEPSHTIRLDDADHHGSGKKARFGLSVYYQSPRRWTAPKSQTETQWERRSSYKPRCQDGKVWHHQESSITETNHQVQQRSLPSTNERKLSDGQRILPNGKAEATPSPLHSSSSLNEYDVDAAELLVHLSVKVPAGGPGNEGAKDGIGHVDSEPQDDDDYAHVARQKRNNRRKFANSISSLLCNDTKPRKKLRAT